MSVKTERIMNSLTELWIVRKRTVRHLFALTPAHKKDTASIRPESIPIHAKTILSGIDESPAVHVSKILNR